MEEKSTLNDTEATNEIVYMKESISIWSKIKIFSGLLSVLLGIFIAYMSYTGKLNTIFSDMIGDVSKYANPYIEIVQDCVPFENGRTYESAYNQSFDSNKWTYFKSEDERIVQVSSKHNALNIDVITQFSVTPIEGSEDEYWIEPYAMRIGEYQLSTGEMGIIIMSIFNDEISQVLTGLFGY